MENISRGPTFGDFVTIRTDDAGRHSCKTTEYKSTDSPFAPSFKYNVLCENLSMDSQKIPCPTLKRRGSCGNLYYISNLLILYSFLSLGEGELPEVQPPWPLHGPLHLRDPPGLVRGQPTPPVQLSGPRGPLLDRRRLPVAARPRRHP